MDFKKLSYIIEENNSFVITSHVNPDADAIGSELALYLLLKKINKEVRVINHSKTPYNLDFLDKEKVIEKYDAGIHKEVLNNADVLFALDLNQSNRLAGMEQNFIESGGAKVCIDHHTDSGNFVDYEFIDSAYSATGEIIYDLIESTKLVELDYDIALQIYAAIMTDTGAFKYDRTTPKVHQIAARLLQTGVKPDYVFDQIYDQSRLSKIKLLGESIASIKLNDSGEIGYQVITREMLERTKAKESEVDGFVNYCLMIKGVKIGLLFFELNDGIKISFRSKGKIPVNKLAAEFGGGGHLNAAGTRLFGGRLNNYVEKVVAAAEKYLTVEDENDI